jgi:hypothetical protein
MCGACAVLTNAPDWVDRVGNPEGVGHDANLTRTAERQRRIALANVLLHPARIRLFDLGLAHVWAAADRLSPEQLVDPLDREQLEALESE